MHFFLEVDDREPGLRLVRAHRNWHGKRPKAVEMVDVPDYASDEPVVFCVELAADETPEGKSVRLAGGLVVTAEPERYGDPAARTASGKHAPVRLSWEEWTLV